MGHQAAYLEGRLHDICRDSAGVEHTFRRDHDESLQDHEEATLDWMYLPPIVMALHMAGVPLDGSLI